MAFVRCHGPYRTGILKGLRLRELIAVKLGLYRIIFTVSDQGIGSTQDLGLIFGAETESSLGSANVISGSKGIL